MRRFQVISSFAMLLATLLFFASQACVAQAQEEEGQVVFTKPYEIKMNLLVSETSNIMSDGATAHSGIPNNVTYEMTAVGGYTGDDGNPAGMVTIDLSNFIETAATKQEELLASVGKSDIDLPVGTDIDNLPDTITYMVRCNGNEAAGLQVQLPDGTCNDVRMLGTKKIPSQAFVMALVCEQVSPMAAFKERCETWSPSDTEGGTMESGENCEMPALADEITNSAGTLEFRSLGNALTTMVEPDASNPDLFTTGLVETTTQLEIVFNIPEGLTSSSGSGGNNRRSRRSVLQQEESNSDFVSQIQERFGGGAQVDGNKVTFNVENDVLDTITIGSLKQLTDDDAQTMMSACT